MTSSTSPQPASGDPPDPPSPLGPLGRFVLGYVLPALLGCFGVASLARAGFLNAEWLGFVLLGLGCFMLMMLLMALGSE